VKPACYYIGEQEESLQGREVDRKDQKSFSSGNSKKFQKADRIGSGTQNRFKIQDSRFKIQDSRFKIQDSRFKIQDSRFKIQDSRFKIQDSRFKIQDSEGEKVQEVGTLGNAALLFQRSDWSFGNEA
jgi:uncharacterized protein YxjI